MLHVAMQHHRTVGGPDSHFMTARPQAKQADIHQRQPNAGNQPGDDRIAGDQLR